MSEEEYQVLVERIYSGALLVGVDRTIARQFFSSVPLSHIKEKTGEAPYFAKYVVLGAQISGLWCLLISFVFAVFAFSWWAALAIPISIWIYIGFTASSATPGGGMVGVSILLSVALFASYVGWFPSAHAAWYAVLVTAALWSQRLLYYASEHFMRAFVMRNRRAYESLSQHIRLQEVQS